MISITIDRVNLGLLVGLAKGPTVMGFPEPKGVSSTIKDEDAYSVAVKRFDRLELMSNEK